jgi:hypothetical protein
MQSSNSSITIESKPTYLYTPAERDEILRQFQMARATIKLLRDELVADIALSNERTVKAAIVLGAFRTLPTLDTSVPTEQQLYFVTVSNSWLRSRGHA